MARVAPAVLMDAGTRSTLTGWSQARSTPQALALRSRIVLRAAEGQSNQQIASELELPEVTVSKWRRAFAWRGLDGHREIPRFPKVLHHRIW